MDAGRTTRQGDPIALTGPVARQVFWRCLSLQASWNEQRLQNLGLLACLAPWLRRQRLSRQELRAICRRYFGFFNTNPYLAGYVVGGLLRLEHEREQGQAVSERQVGGFRDALARACGGLGDQLVWLGLRPALMLLGCLLAWLGRWEGVLGLVAAFAAAQLWWRWRSLQGGFRLGLDVVDALARPGWHRAIIWSRRAALTLTGLLIGVYFAGIQGPGETMGAGLLLGLSCAGFGLPLLVRQLVAAEVQLLLGLVLMFVLALLVV
jgi:mannose/fructose/N-acetylgalactosamine-specific phosphotransferase system component IID